MDIPFSFFWEEMRTAPPGSEDAQLQPVFPNPEGAEEIMKVLGPSFQHEVGDPIRNQRGEDLDFFPLVSRRYSSGFQ